MANVYSLHALALDTTVYGGVVSSDIDEGSEIVADDSGSILYPNSRVLIGSRPTLRFESRSVAQWLTALFPMGQIIPHLPITSENGPLYLYYKRRGATGDASGSTAIRRVINAGVIVPRQIRFSGSQVASIELELFAATDLTDPAMDWDTAVALPSGNAGAAAIHSVRCLRNGSAGSTINAIRDATLDFGVQVQAENPANSLYPTGFAINSCRPVLEATTSDVRAALNLYFASPAAVASGGLIMYIAPVTIGGVSASSNLGLVLRGASSLIFTRSVSLNEEPCTGVIECRGAQGSANTDAAISLSTGLTLPAETAPVLHKRGPIYENGTEIEYVDGSIDLGIDVESIQPAATFSPTQFAVRRFVRSFNFTTHDAEFRAAIGPGRAIDTDFDIWLRKLGDYSEGKSDDTAEHIGLSCSAGTVEPQDLSAQSGEIVRPGFRIMPQESTGASDPVTLSVDAAIA